MAFVCRWRPNRSRASLFSGFTNLVRTPLLWLLYQCSAPRKAFAVRTKKTDRKFFLPHCIPACLNKYNVPLSLSLSLRALITRWESAYTRRHNRKEEDIKFYTEWQSNPRPLHVTDIWHALDHEVWLEKCGIISQYYKKKIKPRDIPIR